MVSTEEIMGEQIEIPNVVPHEVNFRLFFESYKLLLNYQLGMAKFWEQNRRAILQPAHLHSLTGRSRPTPDTVVGHSSGKIRAAFCIKVAYMQGPSTKKRWCRLRWAPDEARVQLPFFHSLVVERQNSPNNVTNAGTRASMNLLEDALDQKGIFIRKLLALVDQEWIECYNETAKIDYPDQITDMGDRDPDTTPAPTWPQLMRTGCGCRMIFNNTLRR